MKIFSWIKDILLTLLFPSGIILAIAGVVVLCSYVIDLMSDHECVVVETGYFHSTEDKDKCRFIASAIGHNYTIKRMSEYDARKEDYKICKECFSESDQNSYNHLKEFSKHLDFVAKHAKESSQEEYMWSSLKYQENFNYDSLYVYIDEANILHISMMCEDVYKNKEAMKTNLNEVESIKTTCEECVVREYVDFIYKIIYDGIYDTSLIGESQEDEY